MKKRQCANCLDWKKMNEFRRGANHCLECEALSNKERKQVRKAAHEKKSDIVDKMLKRKGLRLPER